MDRPSNLMMICGVLIFGERLTLARLKATLSDRFLRFKRFRQRAVQSPTGAYWADDRKFDIGAHVRRVKLRGAAGKAELETLVSELMATPLDPSKPMWQFHLVEGYEGGSAVVVRIHHCYADGIALIQVMLSMTDADREGRRARTCPAPAEAHRNRPDGDPDVACGRAQDGDARWVPILIEKGVGLWHEPGQGGGTCRAGQRPYRGAGEAGVDGRGLAHVLQGQARHRQARCMGAIPSR